MKTVTQRSKFFYLPIFLFLIGGCQEVRPRETTVTIHTVAGRNVEYGVEVAETRSQKRIGLMHREYLPARRGMLFLYAPPRKVSMWMKNTLLSLDILFIDKDGRIVRIEEDTVPGSTETLPSGDKVRAVLELNAGQAKRHGIRPGDRVAW